MIKSIVNINGYWKVIIYFDADYNFFHYINNTLIDCGISKSIRVRIGYELAHNSIKAATITSYKTKVSIILFKHHSNYYDYINSIIHEAEHVKQAILDYYRITDENEPPAYTIAHIATEIIKIFNKHI